MCGIVGAIASRDVVPILTEGLKRLEYRGYDSAGIAVLDGTIRRVRRVGRVAEMERAARAEHLQGIIGIAHTRWATHGGVTEPNAHPHVSGDEIAVVHNGIIENHEEQRARLKSLGYAFESQTDTEVMAHLVHHYFKGSRDLFDATRRAVADLHGAYALGVVALADPDTITGARMGCPLVVGLGEGENFLASDVSAVLSDDPPRDLPRRRRRRGAQALRRARGGPRRATGGPSGARDRRRRGRRGSRPLHALHAEGDPRAAARRRRHASRR